MIHVKETLRKSIHIGSLSIPLFYRYVLTFDRRDWMSYLLLAAFMVSMVIEFQRFWQKSFRKTFWKIFGIVLRKHEVRDFTGATYLLFSAMICVTFFEPEVAFFAMSFLSIGDTFAALVGINLGKRKFRGSNKSLEGSLACFLSCFIYALAFKLNPITAFTGALAATASEVANLPIDDNLEMPLASALVMSITRIFV